MNTNKFYQDISYRLECYKNRDYPVLSPKGKKIEPLDSRMKIVIPTYMREDAKRLVYDQLPEDLKEITYLFTKESRVPFLRKRFPKANIISLPEETHGIADTRQRVLDYFPNDKLWMIDDQVKLQKRGADFRVIGWATGEEIHEMYDWISYCLDFYAEVGVSGRPGNDKYKGPLHENGRCYTCQGLRTDVLRNIGVTFSGMWKETGVIFLEDFYLTLSLLGKGYSNTVVYDFVSDAEHGQKGGNSVLRNVENNNEAWKCLAKTFPGLVKLRTVEGNSWHGDMNTTRYEGTVSWAKAFSTVKPKGALF